MGKSASFIVLLLVVGCQKSPAHSLSGTIDVDTTMQSAPIPDDFLGVSMEWSLFPLVLANGPDALQPLSVGLMRQFANEGHVLVLRVGGNSEDEASWNPTGAPPPAGVSIAITPANLTTLAQLHSALGTRLILGLNLALDDAANAAALIAAARAAIPDNAFMGFELGNEPDRFASIGVRPASYDWTAYITDVNTFHDDIAARFSVSLPFAGPALASRTFLPQLITALPSEASRMSLVTTHVYAFPGCSGSASHAAIDLLSDTATTTIAAKFAPLAAAAHANGLQHRMAEMNSVSCGGATGVSDVYASALWGADIAFSLASAGLDGINFHTPGTYAVWEETVRPLYYGMRFFSLATAHAARFLATTVSAPSRVRAWATVGDDMAIRVAILNEDPSATETLTLRLPGKNATAIRLMAPAIDATTGITLGGQTWDGSTDGEPLGTSHAETLTRAGDNGWTVTLPALQAILVTVL